MAGCATARAPRAVSGASAGLPPWQLPTEAFGSQRLYRVGYDGPEGEGTFRVTLRLASPVRYQIQAVDPVGRSLWGLDVTAERGLWLDHRNKVSCVFEGNFDVSGVPLGPFPLLSLPALLLGRVPAEPSEEAEPERNGGEVEFRDDLGRRWAADVEEDGAVLSWTLWEEQQPSVWFRRRDSWAYLSDRERNVQVRWREVLREELAGEPASLERPAAYREASCRDLYAPRQEPQD